MPKLTIRLLGPPGIEVDGSPIGVDTRKAIALLGYLAVTDQEHARDTLATLLWPESDQSHARAALRRTLSTLNRALEGDWMWADRSTIRLDASKGVDFDVARFRALVKKVEAHGHEAGHLCPDCQRELERAASLYRDDFMAGFTLRDSPGFDDWQFFEAQALRRDYGRILDQLTRAYAHEGRLEEAIGTAERLLALDPLNETSHRHLMELHARRGNRTAALQQYRACVRVLQEELGVAPLDETTHLHEAILEEHGAGEASLPGLFAEPESAGQAIGEHDWQPLPLVDRKKELRLLQRTYAGASSGRFLVIEGEAGIGKTRLAGEAAAFLEAAGARVSATRSYEGERDLAFGTLIDALRSTLVKDDGWLERMPDSARLEAGRLVPAFSADLPDPPSLPPLDTPGAQGRFFELVSRIFFGLGSAEKPGVLVIDNLQWADEATQELLAYLVRRLRGNPLLILATWRSEDVPAAHPFRRWLGQAETEGYGAGHTLARLSQPAVEELVEDLREEGKDLPDGLSGRLYEVTEGLPFFISEYLAILRTSPPAAGSSEWGVPQGVRELLEARLARVGETETQLLGAAAVIGRSFELDVLREASGRGEEETVRGLEALQAGGLIVEVEEPSGARGPAFDFKHEQLRSLMLSRTSRARQRLLHRRVAQALSHGDGGSQVEALASRIANHLLQAGEKEQAAEYFKRAGDRARELFANAEALAHYRQALSLGHPGSAELLEAIGDLLTLRGEYADALASYHAAASYGEGPASARLERKLGAVYQRRGDWAQAEDRFDSAAAMLEGNGPNSELARVLADWSLTNHRTGHPRKARSLAKRALESAERSEDGPALAQIHNLLGILARHSGDLKEAQAELESSLGAAEALGDPFVRAAALNNMALVLGESGEYDRALELGREALALARAHGDLHREAAIQTNIADLLHACGRTEEAMPHLKESVRILTQIGVEEGTYQPEVWKLVEW